MEVQEYLEKKLLEDHGEADEQERPGIAGGRLGSKKTRGDSETQTQTAMNETSVQSECISPHSVSTDRTAGMQNDGATLAGETTTRSRVSVKRPAETEADDSSRGDRIDWRNFTEASSSNHAPGVQVPTAVRDNVVPAPGRVEGVVISDDAVADARISGGVKRNQEDHATMEYDGSEVEVKSQRISSIHFGIRHHWRSECRPLRGISQRHGREIPRGIE